MDITSDLSILVTGGTGSFGKAFVRKIIEQFPKTKRLIIFSRDELKQWQMQQEYPEIDFPQLRFFLGDIRDKNRLNMALEGVDLVIHAAALKQVPAAEYNPMEFIKTNVIGSQNLIEACTENNVKKVIALSTDKASSPINLYGATKLCSDKLFIAANNIVGSRALNFSVVRYGNVMGSRGSVIPLFIEKSRTGIIPITDKAMTRFNITLEKSVETTLWAIKNSFGGEIIIPKIPSYKICDLVNAIAPNSEIEIIGTRPGEKLHEEMISLSDSPFTIDVGSYYLILPPKSELFNKYLSIDPSYEFVKNGFSYSSETNNDFLTVDDIRSLIKEYTSNKLLPL